MHSTRANSYGRVALRSCALFVPDERCVVRGDADSIATNGRLADRQLSLRVREKEGERWFCYCCARLDASLCCREPAAPTIYTRSTQLDDALLQLHGPSVAPMLVAADAIAQPFLYLPVRRSTNCA